MWCWDRLTASAPAEGLYGKSVRRKDYFTADEGAYLAQYAGAHYVRTKKKAGWDCWRHLEIIVAGVWGGAEARDETNLIWRLWN